MSIPLHRAAAAALLAIAMAAPAAAQRPVPVDLELAFVVDASGSIDADETRLQRQGYADALVNPRVLRAIKGGFLESIAVAYVEFAGPDCGRISVNWTRISDAASAATFGKKVLAVEPMFCPGGNAIADAVLLAAGSIKANAFEGTRRVIDVSGDGPNTIGPDMAAVRDTVVAQRIIINGLVIERPSFPDLDAYFRNEITGGPGSFVIKAKDRATFGEAILRKMIREIVDRQGAPPALAHRQKSQAIKKK
jgi:hypothetical protein